MKNVCASMYYGSYSLPTYVTIWNADAFWMTTLVPIAKWRNQQIIHLVNIGRGSSLAFIKFSH